MYTRHAPPPPPPPHPVTQTYTCTNVNTHTHPKHTSHSHESISFPSDLHPKGKHTAAGHCVQNDNTQLTNKLQLFIRRQAQTPCFQTMEWTITLKSCNSTISWTWSWLASLPLSHISVLGHCMRLWLNRLQINYVSNIIIMTSWLLAWFLHICINWSVT